MAGNDQTHPRDCAGAVTGTWRQWIVLRSSNTIQVVETIPAPGSRFFAFPAFRLKLEIFLEFFCPARGLRHAQIRLHFWAFAELKMSRSRVLDVGCFHSRINS